MMKTLNILRNEKGVVLATFEQPDAASDGIPISAVVDRGETVERMENVPLDYSLDLTEFIARLGPRKG